MKLEQALDFMENAASEVGSDQFDIIASEAEDTSVRVYKGKVKSTEISASQGIGIRLIRNGKPGYSFTRRLSESAILQCIHDAADLSQYSAPCGFSLPTPQKLKELDLKLWNDDLQNIGTQDLLDISFKLEKLAESADDRIENVLSSAAGRSSARFYLLNSNGIKWQSRRNSTMAGVSLVAAKGDIKKSGGHYHGTRDFSNFDVDEITKRAVAKAVDLLDAAPIPHGNYPVIFDHDIAPGMIRSFVPALYADTVQKGQSKLAGKIGEQIANECFTLYNDPFVADMPGSGLIDSEGIPSQKFNVVTNGVLNTFLYNLESAAKEGRHSTGSGSRSYAGKAGTGFDNLFIAKGKRSLKGMLNSQDKCLLVTRLEGSGIRSAVSGEISVGIQGFLYEKGKKTQAVDRVTVSGNYFDLLKNIGEFSNNYSDSFSSSKVADMLINNMTVSG
ncbi:MAG: TldD/PmbA family protein [Lentisphaeraceae bacterium]|nr:TldD/PmbA family protein [Lentisphaeraceae bacterium]